MRTMRNVINTLRRFELVTAAARIVCYRRPVMARTKSATICEGVQLGPYRLIERIGKGGMGEVWRAEHVLLGRHAAVKVLNAVVSGSEEVVARFFNEARAATAIADPGIVQIFDFGYHTDGRAYLVMELLAGETLERRLERVGPLGVDDALRLIRQVASSLGAAHARGIVHRDLKPENIYIVRDPEVPGGERIKLLDFGIAKLTADPVVHATGTGAMLGTPLYMAPEQCHGAELVDQRSDIYALGCVLYTLLVGRPPFIGAGVGELFALHMFEPPPLASQQRPGIPASIDALLAGCLAKDPEERFGDGRKLAVAIDQLLDDPMTRTSLGTMAQGRTSVREPSARRATVATLAASPPAPAMSQPRMRPHTTLSASAGVAIGREPVRPQRSWLGIASLGVVAVVGGVASFWLLRVPPDEPTHAAAVAPTPPRRPRADAAPASVAPVASPLDVARSQISATLTAFRTWTASHTGAPCPGAGELATRIAGGVVDPWGHPLAITCSEQPADQMIGVTSAGPDGTLGTSDDVVSWQLGSAVTAIVAGPRWHALPRAGHTAPPVARSTPAAAQPSPSPQPPPASRFEHTTLDSDGIPTSR
jgi:serine/threonine protein kinase